MSNESAETPDLESLARLFTIPREPAVALVRELIEQVFNIEVTGTDNIPTTGGALLICNHTDLIDVPVQAVYSPRKIIFLGKRELFEPDLEAKQFLYQEGSPMNLPGLNLVRPIVERLLETYAFMQRAQFLEWGGVPIIRNFRGEGARAAAEYYHDLENYMVDLLKQGHFLSIFPEGTRTETGIMNPFKALAAKLAVRAQVPIVPSGISGAFNFLNLQNLLSGGMFKRKIRWNVGRPLPPGEFPPGDEKRASKELTALLEKQVYALTLHPERREYARGKARDL